MASQVPAKLKAITHYVKIGNEHAARDPAVHYWCLLHSVQKGMQIDKSSPECKQFLIQHMDLLEKIKEKNKGNEAITNDVIASAHIEEVAMNLFAFADVEDRAGRFNKNVVKAFYTAGYLFDVLACFGEPDTQILQQQKYAKWKAAYIHNCLKNGETPVPGPVGGDEGFGDEFGGYAPNADGGNAIDNFSIPVPSSNNAVPSPTPAAAAAASSPIPPAAVMSLNSGGGGSDLQPADFMKAQKLCKYAISALEYEDAATAVENLKKALEALQVKK